LADGVEQRLALSGFRLAHRDKGITVELSDRNSRALVSKLSQRRQARPVLAGYGDHLVLGALIEHGHIGHPASDLDARAVDAAHVYGVARGGEVRDRERALAARLLGGDTLGDRLGRRPRNPQ